MKLGFCMHTAILYLFSGFSIATGSDTLTVANIMAKPSITGQRARIIALSPDGSQLLYRYDSDGDDESEFYLADTRSGESALFEGIENSGRNIVWHPNEPKLLYLSNGDIYVYDFSANDSKQLTKTPEHESSLNWTKDGSAILYRYEKTYHIMNIRDGTYVQINSAPGENEADNGGRLSPDNEYFLFERENESGLWKMHWSDYIPETVQPKSSMRGVNSGIIGLVKTDGKAEVRWINPDLNEKYRIFSFAWSPDSKKVVVQLVSVDFHTRKLFVYTVEEESWKEVWHEEDKKWIGGPRLGVDWSPSGDKLLIASEKSGWNQLYLNETKKKKSKSLTKGKWEVQEFHWITDEKILFASNEKEFSERHFYILDVKSKKRKKLNTKAGYNSGIRLSSNGSMIAYTHDNQGQPSEIYALSVEEGAEPVRISNTIPDDYSGYGWTIPEIVEFKSHVDGKKIRANLYMPDSFEKDKKYPTIFFVHGAGYMQNVKKSWTHYWREFMFNTLLNRAGYVVIDVDYRGSAGYGRDWRTDVYMHLGGRDLDDIISGVKWGISEGFIDKERIGIYGGSYGGFMAIMALVMEPDVFATGAGLRSVTDWENYYYSNPFYTAKRLGIPEENKEAYVRSSPIHHTDNMKSPLLLLHGVLDNNVQFQDAAQLVQKLIDGGKKFDLMIYPKEAHSFKSPEAWTDEYTRIFEQMEKYVRNK